MLFVKFMLEILKKEYISKIEEMGILEVYVKEDQENEIAILKNI